MAGSRIKWLVGIAGASTVRFWVLVPATRAHMPSGLSTGGFMVLVLRVPVLSCHVTANTTVSWLGYQLGSWTSMPSALSIGGFWVLVPGIRVLICRHDCKQKGSGLGCQGTRASMSSGLSTGGFLVLVPRVRALSCRQNW